MEIPAIVKECERIGVKSLGITDHLNSLEKLLLHVPIRNDIESLNTKLEVYFGVELNFTAADGGFACSREVKEQYGFQFAIGGIHGVYLDTYDRNVNQWQVMLNRTTKKLNQTSGLSLPRIVRRRAGCLRDDNHEPLDLSSYINELLPPTRAQMI